MLNVQICFSTIDLHSFFFFLIEFIVLILQELLRLWIKLQYQADQSTDRFISSLWAVAKVSLTTEQLLYIIDAVREEVRFIFIDYDISLYNI